MKPRTLAPVCPKCGVAQEGTYLRDRSIDDLVCLSCRNRVGDATSTPPAGAPFGSRFRRGGRKPAGRTSVKDLRGLRPVTLRRIP